MSVYGMKGNGGFVVKKLEVNGKILMDMHASNVAVASANNIYDAFNPKTAGTTSLLNVNLLAQPYPARRIAIKAIAAGTADQGDKLTVNGYDSLGDLRSEDVIVSSAADGINYTNYAYTKIVSITADDAAHKSTDVNIGVANVFGLSYPIASSGDVVSIAIDGAHATTSPISAVSEQYSCVSFTPTATKSFDIQWFTKLQDLD